MTCCGVQCPGLESDCAGFMAKASACGEEFSSLGYLQLTSALHCCTENAMFRSQNRVVDTLAKYAFLLSSSTFCFGHCPDCILSALVQILLDNIISLLILKKTL